MQTLVPGVQGQPYADWCFPTSYLFSIISPPAKNLGFQVEPCCLHATSPTCEGLQVNYLTSLSLQTLVFLSVN